MVCLRIRKIGCQFSFATWKLCDFGEVTESLFISILITWEKDMVFKGDSAEINQPAQSRSSIDIGFFPLSFSSFLQ